MRMMLKHGVWCGQNLVASGWCGMWIKPIALCEEHGMVPCGDYSIDEISEIKSTDELMECYYNDTEEIHCTVLPRMLVSLDLSVYQ